MQRRKGAKLGSTALPNGSSGTTSGIGPEKDSAVETLKSLPLSKELLQYYRERIERHEGALKEAEGRIKDIRLEHTARVTLETRLTARESEVAVLQSQLSEAQECVARERGRLFRIVAENDDLRARELADRRKIRQLLMRLEEKDKESVGSDTREIHKSPKDRESRAGTPQSVTSISSSSWEHTSCSSCSCTGVRVEGEGKRIYQPSYTLAHHFRLGHL